MKTLSQFNQALKVIGCTLAIGISSTACNLIFSPSQKSEVDAARKKKPAAPEAPSPLSDKQLANTTLPEGYTLISTDTDLNQKAVLAAMLQIREHFHTNPQPGVKKVSRTIVKNCLDNDVPSWSDIQHHYYCQLPGHEPEIRSCFTFSVRGQLGWATRNPLDAYEFCLYDGTEKSTNTDYENRKKTGPWHR